ncbi:hypothetical protein PIROE2DRAFT_11862 [Piromyces sp. E2]|nr:hypothetical protein PIROE2DRAFT_11862 [Piromyces sp. E2]|eukprot:OUM61983.1 hypothetical protein PIROE2DRAFT_11862 [Piromyces sp. E2]
MISNNQLFKFYTWIGILNHNYNNELNLNNLVIGLYDFKLLIITSHLKILEC